MEIQPTLTRRKLTLFMDHALMGLAEIDKRGTIIHLNQKGETLLEPVRRSNHIKDHNFYTVLTHIAPAIIGKIKDSDDEAGNIVANELHSFFLTTEGKKTEQHFNFTVIKMFTDCIIVVFEDITDQHDKDRVLQQLMLDKAVILGKYEIASNVLHDIGNAVVGFSSYLNRIKQSLELDNAENLQQLALFLETQRLAIAGAIGEPKADALVKIAGGIVQTQKSNQADISKSITEQEKIINHIREILNIQRQYINGNEINERRALHLDSIINDCVSMLFASFTKRNITVTRDIPGGLPVIEGDHTRLMQVILNILKNSIEAIDVYAIEKTIAISIIYAPGLLVLQIQDSGKGFDEITAKKLFSRGFTTKSAGSGLGLNSCKTIIEDHDGTVHITSEGPGKGALTTIKFNIRTR